MTFKIRGRSLAINHGTSWIERKRYLFIITINWKSFLWRFNAHRSSSGRKTRTKYIKKVIEKEKTNKGTKYIIVQELTRIIGRIYWVCQSVVHIFFWNFKRLNLWFWEFFVSIAQFTSHSQVHRRIKGVGLSNSVTKTNFSRRKSGYHFWGLLDLFQRENFSLWDP